MKEFTITVTSERPIPVGIEAFSIPPAGPRIEGDFLSPLAMKKESNITSVTLTARLVDVEYEEAQAFLEKMKEDAKKT